MHMGHEDITIYMKAPILLALRDALKRDGLELESILCDYLDELYNMSVDPNIIAEINAMLAEHEEAARLEAIANRRFTAVQVTQGSVTRYAQVNHESYSQPNCRRLSIVAPDLRNYLRSENKKTAFFDRYNSSVEITQEQYEADCASIGDPDNPHCTYALCFDFDYQLVGENDGSGWHFWDIKDVSSAAYFAYKAGRMKPEAVDKKFYERLVDKEISPVSNQSMHEVT